MNENMAGGMNYGLPCFVHLHREGIEHERCNTDYDREYHDETFQGMGI
jgi:hypothetical protein